MKTVVLLLTALCLLIGCEESNRIIPIINDVKIGVSSMDMESLDPLKGTIQLDISSGIDEVLTDFDKLMGEWAKSNGDVGLCFYSDNTFGVMSFDEDTNSWIELKSAGTFALLDDSTLTLIFSDGDEFHFSVRFGVSKMQLVNKVDNERTLYQRLRA